RGVGRRVVAEQLLDLLLRPDRVVLDHREELRDLSKVPAIGERVAVLVGPALRDLRAERNRVAARARAEERGARPALDAADDALPVHSVRIWSCGAPGEVGLDADR